MIRQRHGIANAARLSEIESSETQSVLVTDYHCRVVLSLSACTYPAGLTPDQARFIAQELIDSAKRVEDAIYKKAGAK